MVPFSLCPSSAHPSSLHPPGLSKAHLKDIWAAVAGDQGDLTRQHFIQAAYLIDHARRGGSLPATLAPDFPPRTGQATGAARLAFASALHVNSFARAVAVLVCTRRCVIALAHPGPSRPNHHPASPFVQPRPLPQFPPNPTPSFYPSRPPQRPSPTKPRALPPAPACPPPSACPLRSLS